MNRFGQLKLITTHMGAWYDWDEVERELLGQACLYGYLGQPAIFGQTAF
jgi:hypothetical protein